MSTSAQRHAHTHAPARAHAAARYRTLDIGSRIDGASPHALVAMLFAGLREALVSAQAEAAGGRGGRQAGSATRAIAIVDALAGSLDFGRGGSVAPALAAAYADIRAIIVAAQQSARAELFGVAAAQVGTLADGWEAIGREVSRASRA